MGTTDSINAGNSTNSNYLESLRAKYKNSNEALNTAKSKEQQYANAYLEAKAKYGITAPSKVSNAKDNYQKYSSLCSETDMYNTFLNHQLFDAILSNGGMNFIS